MDRRTRFEPVNQVDPNAFERDLPPLSLKTTFLRESLLRILG